MHILTDSWSVKGILLESATIQLNVPLLCPCFTIELTSHGCMDLACRVGTVRLFPLCGVFSRALAHWIALHIETPQRMSPRASSAL